MNSKSLLKPIYLYLIAGLFLMGSRSFSTDQSAIKYILLTLGVVLFIYAVVKHLRE